MEQNRKVMVITGANGGLGAAISRLALNKGYKLVLGGKDEAKIQAFCNDLGQPDDVMGVACDVSQQMDCFGLIDEAVKRFGRVDILINNAGVLKFSPINKITPDELWDTFEVNLFGAIFCSQAALNVMKKQNSGLILNIGSTSAIDYQLDHISYSTSKAALVAFTGNLRKELEGTGITACAFSPGGIKTELFRNHPSMDLSAFMEPMFVAEKIFGYIENPIKDWHVVLRRPGQNAQK
jgi:NAD(P)-dependent dehydrogenase (short-subunit alcohol dehydrogenase family)